MKLIVSVTLIVLLLEQFHCAPIAVYDDDDSKYIETIETNSWGYKVGGHLNLGVNAGFKDGKLSLGTENDIGADIGGHNTKSTKRTRPPTPSNGYGNGYNSWPSYGQPIGQYYGQPTGQYYGQPAWPQYYQPGPQYYQPTGPQYPQTAWSYYGQPAGQQYGQPIGPQYGQPNGPQYGHPTGAQYGQSNGSQYGQPTGPQYSQPRQPAAGSQSGPGSGGPNGPAPGGQNGQGGQAPGQMNPATEEQFQYSNTPVAQGGPQLPGSRSR